MLYVMLSLYMCSVGLLDDDLRYEHTIYKLRFYYMALILYS